MNDYKKFLQGLKPAQSEDIKKLYKKINELDSKMRELEEKYNTSEQIRKTLEIDLKDKEEKVKEYKWKYEKSKEVIAEKNKEIKDLKEKGNCQSHNSEDLNKIKELENLINLKDRRIIELERIILDNDKNKIMDYIKNNLNNQRNENNQNNFVLNVTSTNFSHALICSEDEVFAFAEEKLYQKFSEYRETNNTFMANGNVIKRFKTMKENKLVSGQQILMTIFEDEENNNNNQRQERININNSNQNQNNISSKDKDKDQNKNKTKASINKGKHDISNKKK